MRSIYFLIFFSIVLTIYGSVNYYLFVRGLQAFSLSLPMKRWFIVIFWTIVSMFIVGNVLERTATSAFSEWIYRIGSFWMALMLYLFIAVVLIDFIRILDYFFHFLPPFSQIMRFRLGLIVFSIVSVVIDETVTLPNGIQLIGRNDRSASRMNGGLKSLDQLLSGIDNSKPVIVMNHQPFNLDEVAKANVDLHLSGHTHNGQLWPFNYITEAIFELSWGLMKKGNTNFYVSSGYGTWGPSVRIGNRPEVVVFNLKFE